MIETVSVKERIMSDKPYYVRLLEMAVQDYRPTQVADDYVIKQRGHVPDKLQEDIEWITKAYWANEIPDELFPDFWGAAIAALLIPDPGIEHYPGSSWQEIYAEKRENTRRFLIESRQ